MTLKGIIMKILRISLLTLAATAAFLLTACGGGPSIGGDTFMYNGHNFGENRNADFQKGVRDGCKTSTGAYTKNHALFNNNNSYHTGWEDGRINCKGTK